MVSVRNGTYTPSWIRPVSRDAASIGSIAMRFCAAGATEIEKDRVLSLQLRSPNPEAFRASSQVNICRADTTGTPLASAVATIALEIG